MMIGSTIQLILALVICFKEKTVNLATRLRLDALKNTKAEDFYIYLKISKRVRTRFNKLTSKFEQKHASTFTRIPRNSNWYQDNIGWKSTITTQELLDELLELIKEKVLNENIL